MEARAMSAKTLLAVGAHHDDTEYAAGGLILQAVHQGWRVVLVDLCGDHSSWEPTAGREDEVRAGLLAIAADMGVEKRFYEWRYHHLYHEERTVEIIAELVAELQPDLGLIHWPHDYWPDHAAAGRLCQHALRFPHALRPGLQPVPRILMYETGANQTDPAVTFRPDVYIDVSAEMDRVCAIIHRLDEVASGQPIAGPSSHEQDKRAKSRLRGAECGVMYAEAFAAVQKWPQDIL
jgi:LmbE family N-acetylglucosaminyl deacetylase